ncbi:MAG TPA: ectoine/hydroxyectoine ABC transporter substrate-binding protein EhuB [Pseudonocardia sp.]|jgi:polar amino acid transport system substrate-binding protein|nr:ectoine/hydroxyectoine ABC transporter substrate-binding protein EhuB [Pseudonocardia sp.]
MLSRRHLLTAVGVGVLAAGCGRDSRPTLQRITQDGSVRIGVSNEMPFSYLDSNGEATGESPEVARAVLAGIGVHTLQSVQRPFDQLIPGLTEGLFDIVAAAMQISPDRCGTVVFSEPDLLTPTGLLVQHDNPLRLRNFADVRRAGVSIVVMAGGVEEMLATGAGVPADRIEKVEFPDDLYQAVAEQRAPVGSLTDISLRDIMRRHPASPLEVVRVSGRTAPRIPAAGFAFRREDTALRDAFNAGLTRLRASGDWLRVTAPFGVTASDIPPADLTTEALCRAI